MSSLQKYLELKKKVEQAQQKADKAEGAFDQVMKDLKNKFGCETLEAAKKKLRFLEKQEQKLEAELKTAIEKFEEEWGEEEVE